ncbi:signal peptidase I [Nocardioides caricicola]|uniref:Signal peptidase I n=1 Tax=Nocardioides caricicola TaxID=634770 RepID=A0ABW0N9P7_9ACTN
MLSWFVMFAIGAMLMASLVVPRLAGAATYVIETGSMRPHLPPGTMIAVQPADASAVKVGDVITYQLRSGDPTVVTHRVVAVGYDGEGQMRWQTQGDANPAADRLWVRPAQLRGRLWYGVPMLGHVTAIVTQQQRRVIVGAAAVGLIGYALTQFGSAWRDRRHRTVPTTGGGRRKA